MPTKTEVQLANERFFELLMNSSMDKSAADAISEFTRTKIREDSFAERIMPSLTITNDQLDRQYWTDKPAKVVDKEPDVPPAISVPYGSAPVAYYIRGPRYLVTFARIYSSLFTKDIGELRTWQMDIRQVMADNAIKEMLTELDSKFISMVNSALISQGGTVPASGSIQWQNIVGGITRDSWEDGLKIMPNTKFNLEASSVLMNNITIYEFKKWRRDEVGGDLSQEILRDGWQLRKFDNRDVLITIKKDLVPTSTIYYFADPKFMGKTYELEPTTMWIKREHVFVEWFCYRELGSTLGHTGGVARADFT